MWVKEKEGSVNRMKKEQVFSTAIRVVFLFAFGAFLFASIHHIATFFDNFEQDSGNWVGSYALAISIDATALVLTIGVMFFRKNMPWYAQVFVWFFIIALTAFSWVVNWEYALRFQSGLLTDNPTLKMINPILASSFAFLNLAYSLVSEFFSARVETVADIEAEATRLEGLISVQKRLDIARETLKKPSLIQRAKGVVIEVKSAANEVIMQPHIETDIVTNESDMQDDIIPAMEEEHPAYAPRKRDELGMVEGVMYDKVTEDKSILITLLYEAQMNPISDLTTSLQRQFSGYANYITETRVQRVFDAICADYPELISLPNDDDMEPDTDPELETISPANDVHISGEIVADLPANITDISNAKKRENDAANQDRSRGSYAITKEAASERLHCSLAEIERGIKLGIIQPFAKDRSKVLVKSLGGFTPQKRGRKVAAK